MKRIAALFAIALVAGMALWLALPTRVDAPQPFLGYVEAETLLLAPKQTGRLLELAAEEGDTVAAGRTLFVLDDEEEKAAVAEAAARLERARAQLADLRAARQRPAQIEVLEARRRQAEAALDLSRAELERQKRLFSQNVIAESRLDAAETAFRRDRSALAAAEREIEAARLPAREAEIKAAEAEVEAASAALARARTALAERTVSARRGGKVLDVLYRTGEVVPAGQPVLEILPPENLLVRFYAPEPTLAGLSRGDRVAIACDGCPGGLTGEIVFIAGEAEFTPPVIFSRQERAKLVFLVKARPTDAAGVLKPGLPVEVLPQ